MALKYRDIVIDRQVERRFLSYIAIHTDGCWYWVGASRPNSSGKLFYGHFRIGLKMVLVHRVAYKMWVGNLKAYPQSIDHLCNHTLCIKPDHLRQIDIKENTLAGTGPTAINARKTQCKRGHRLNGNNLAMRKDRYERICLQCKRIHEIKRNEKRRQS